MRTRPHAATDGASRSSPDRIIASSSSMPTVRDSIVCSDDSRRVTPAVRPVARNASNPCWEKPYACHMRPRCCRRSARSPVSSSSSRAAISDGCSGTKPSTPPCGNSHSNEATG